LLRTIDCSNYGRMTDICFVNATTAYATHPDSNVVSVIDLTVELTRPAKYDEICAAMKAASQGASGR